MAEQDALEEIDGQEQAPLLSYDEDSPNIALDLAQTDEGLKWLKDLSRRCYDNYESAWDGCEQYRIRVASDWRIFSGDLPPKNEKFKDVPNPHMPIMLTNLSRIHARAFGELFGDWSNVMNVVPVGPDDKQTALLLSRHGNWQIRQKIPDFKRQMDRALLIYFLNGDVTCHSYFDPFTQRNSHEILTTDQFCIPYVYTTTMPDYSDVPFKCKIMRRARHELQRYRGKWLDVDKVLERKAPSWDENDDTPLRTTVAEIKGEEIPSDLRGDLNQYKLIWYEGWLTLPGDEDERYCVCILDDRSRAILMLRLHEQDDWQDRIRFDRQQQELDGYTQAAAMYAEQSVYAQEQEAAVRARLQDPDVHPEEAAMMQQALAQSPIPPPPVPPQWWSEESPTPAPVRKVPIQMFSHGVCLEPIVGSLGLSYGRIESDLNRAANIALSQFADGADLNNTKSFFTHGVEFENGPPQLYPGAQIKVKSMIGARLQDSIMPFEPGPASPQLPQLVNMMAQFAEGVLQAPGVLSGESGKSGETYRGILARIEQATKQLSVATRKFADFLETVLCHNGYLNSIHMPDDELFYVSDHLTGEQHELRAGKALYQRDYKVEIRADLRFTTQAQRIAEADEALQLATIVPPLAGNLAYWYQATKQSLEAREQFELIRQLGPQPPPPPTPMGITPMGMPPGSPGATPPGGGGEPAHPAPMAAQGAQPQNKPPSVQQVSDHGGAAPPNAPVAPGVAA